MPPEVVLLDAGLALVLVGAGAIARPLPRLGLPTRRRGALLSAAGGALALVAALLPARTLRLDGPPMAIDAVVPRYEFGEAHEIRIHASRERAWSAVLAVTADEIRFFRTLTWLRAPHLGGAPRGILNPAAGPILDSALESGFIRLAEEPGRELVVGTIVCCGAVERPRTPEEFRTLAAPDQARAVMNFHLSDDGNALRLVTQTRIHVTSAVAARRFAAYWRVIYPGSALIRRMWLDAIRRRAEGGA